jgi:hypothetical protein
MAAYAEKSALFRLVLYIYIKWFPVKYVTHYCSNSLKIFSIPEDV